MLHCIDYFTQNPDAKPAYNLILFGILFYLEATIIQIANNIFHNQREQKIHKKITCNKRRPNLQPQQLSVASKNTRRQLLQLVVV